MNRLLLCGAACLPLAAGPAQAVLSVSFQPTKNVACSAGTCTSTAADAVLNFGEFAGMLAAGKLTVVAESKARDISFDVGVSYTSANALTLTAFGKLRFNQAFSVRGRGDLTLNANPPQYESGLVFADKARLSLWDRRSDLTIDGAPYKLVYCVTDLAEAVAATPDGHIALAKSCDAGPDGVYPAAPVATPFTGVFQGFNNTISNLRIDDKTPSHDVGLFSAGRFNGSDGTIENLRLVHADIQGADNSHVGGAVGWQGMLAGIRVSGRVAGGNVSHVGGLAGAADDITYSASAVDVTGGNGSLVGGIVGDGGLLTHSSSSGDVKAGNQLDSSVEAVAGGAMGYSINAHMQFVSATGHVSVGSQSEAGGLLGLAGDGDIADSFATGAVRSGDISETGGLVGGMSGSVTRSYATGNVTAGDDSSAGGLIGHCIATVADAYALGRVKAGARSYAGGFTGTTFCGFSGGAYSTGSAKAGAGGAAGGFAGIFYGGANTATLYWDLDTSGMDRGVGQCGAGGACETVQGIADETLKARLHRGFAPSVWGLSPGINGGLPYLLALPPR